MERSRSSGLALVASDTRADEREGIDSLVRLPSAASLPVHPGLAARQGNSRESDAGLLCEGLSGARPVSGRVQHRYLVHADCGKPGTESRVHQPLEVLETFAELHCGPATVSGSGGLGPGAASYRQKEDFSLAVVFSCVILKSETSFGAFGPCLN